MTILRKTNIRSRLSKSIIIFYYINCISFYSWDLFLEKFYNYWMVGQFDWNEIPVYNLCLSVWLEMTHISVFLMEHLVYFEVSKSTKNFLSECKLTLNFGKIMKVKSPPILVLVFIEKIVHLNYIVLFLNSRFFRNQQLILGINIIFNHPQNTYKKSKRMNMWI